MRCQQVGCIAVSVAANLYCFGDLQMYEAPMTQQSPASEDALTRHRIMKGGVRPLAANDGRITPCKETRRFQKGQLQGPRSCTPQVSPPQGNPQGGLSGAPPGVALLVRGTPTALCNASQLSPERLGNQSPGMQKERISRSFLMVCPGANP